MKWTIVCDSSCDILSLAKLGEDTEFYTAPLKIIIDTQNFVDDRLLDRKSLLDAILKSKSASSSSCPSPIDWLEHFEKGENVVAISISSELSGSYNSALVARDMFLEKHPDRKIHIINSRSTSGRMVLLAKKVNELIIKGLSFEALTTEIELYNDGLNFIFCLKNYTTVIKNGRMSPFLGAVATALGIMAISVTSTQGAIEVISKQRGEQNAYRYMVNHMKEKKVLKNKPVYISHCDNAKGADILKGYLKELCGCTDVTIFETRGLCSYYASVGGIMVSY